MNAKVDARKLDTATQAHLRRLAVRAVQGGMTQAQAARTFGVSLRAVAKWMRLVREGGPRALVPQRRGRRAGGGKLDAQQAARMRALIVQRMPDALGLGCYLWTRAAVMRLIERECGVVLAASTAGNYLRAWGMSPQKPVRRALRALRCGRGTLAHRAVPGPCAPGPARRRHDCLGR